MKAKVIMVVATKRSINRSVVVADNYPRSKKVKGSVIKYYNDTAMSFRGPGNPIEPIATESLGEILHDSFFPRVKPNKYIVPRMYDELSFWVDPNYSVLMRDKGGMSYKRDIELKYDRGRYTDFNSISGLKKAGLSFDVQVAKKDVDLTIVYTEDGKCLISSKGQKKLVELPGIQLLKVNVRLNPERKIEVDLVYADDSVPASDQTNRITEKVLTLKFGYTPKKRFGLFEI